ncbi:MAG: HlyD family efflux transporter periplasmic adaptor subunit [Arcobacteraceae bacterium]
MRSVILLCLLGLSAFAHEYYAKIEPAQSYVIKAAVNAEVVYTNEAIEGQTANNSLIIELDSKVDKVDLEQTKNKLALFEKMIEIEQNNYERLKKVTTRSDFDKDSQLLKSINLQSTKADLLIKIAQLQSNIAHKKLFENNRYIYSINVKKGDWVNAGTLLYEAKDLSQGKLEIFVPISEASLVLEKQIYLNSEPTNLKIDKMYKVADAKNISAYKVEIMLPKPKEFSSLVKIEFK